MKSLLVWISIRLIERKMALPEEYIQLQDQKICRPARCDNMHKGGYYTVICRKDNRGIKAVECTCQGGEKGLVCYHAVAALSLHVGLARQRQITIV
jgi:hypothetical protein